MATNETNESPNSTVDGSVRVGAVKEEGGADTRSNSPDPSCPICLDNVTDAAYTDMCCHRFCFHCLVTWSRVKPECPLCKQRFSLIIHNVRSWADYDQLPVAWPDPPSPALDANFFISVAFQRPRFRYRTTGGSWGWRFQDVLGGPSTTAGSSTLLPSSSLHNPLPPSSLVTSHSYSPPINSAASFPPTPSSYIGNTVATEWRRRRQVSAVEFRRNIYRQNRWVCPAQPRPGTPVRVRDCTPSFYRNNAAQVHRLIPWLHRELLVLLDVCYDYQEVCQMICHAITNIPIRSPRFQSMLWPYLRERTAHFCHEFYHFASSPYDMLAYDLRAEYVRRIPPGLEMPLLSDHENNSDSSDIEVIETFSREEPIEISDEEVIGVEVGGNDSDASVEIISTLPPMAEREPEIIDLVDDSGSDMEIENDVSSARPSCLRREGDERLRNDNLLFYKDESSGSGDLQIEPCISSLRPSCSEERRERAERLRNKDLHFYKDESSSSEEELPRRKQLRKRKKKCIKPLKKRKRIIENYSSSSDNEEVQDQPHKSDNDSDQSNLETKQTRSKTKLNLSSMSSSPSQEKRSSSKSSLSNSTGSCSRTKSDCSNINSPQPSTSRGKCRDKKRPIEPHETVSSDFLMKYESNSPQNFTPPSPTTAPYLSNSNLKTELPDAVRAVDNFLNMTDWSGPQQWARQLCPESNCVLLGDQLLNSYSSRSRTPPKPRLKSVVRKVEPKEEAGCSNWHSHNLRQRKFMSYAYTPYFSSSDSDDS